MNKKAIFLDVDGTLVANHREMSEKVKEGIKKARTNRAFDCMLKINICTI